MQPSNPSPTSQHRPERAAPLSLLDAAGHPAPDPQPELRAIARSHVRAPAKGHLRPRFLRHYRHRRNAGYSLRHAIRAAGSGCQTPILDRADECRRYTRAHARTSHPKTNTHSRATAAHWWCPLSRGSGGQAPMPTAARPSPHRPVSLTLLLSERRAVVAPRGTSISAVTPTSVSSMRTVGASHKPIAERTPLRPRRRWPRWPTRPSQMPNAQRTPRSSLRAPVVDRRRRLGRCHPLGQDCSAL